MEKMYQEYKDIADFYIVYISEAHASDDKRPVGYAKELGIKEHTNYGERCSVADRLTKDKKLTIPCLVDGMDNAVDKAYKAWPDRVYLVRKDGTLGVAAKRGPWGFKPGVDASRAWLASYKETGREPVHVDTPEDEIDEFELQGELARAYGSGDYKKALAVGEKLYQARPQNIGNIYNIACMHCLLGNRDKAYTWLEKAIDAGYSEVDHLLGDDDFKSIRQETRFKELVEGLREKAQRREQARANPAMFAPVLGEWEMKTALGDNSIEATMTLSVKDGVLMGTWASQGREMPMTDLSFVTNKLIFKRSLRGGRALEFEGTVQGDRITGMYDGPFGELESNGRRNKDRKPAGADSSGG